MGWTDKIAQTIKQWVGSESEQRKVDVGRGSEKYETAFSGASEGTGWSSHMQEDLRIHADLLRRYADYEDMDDYPEITSALDIFADDATIPDTVHGKTIWATSPDKTVRDILNNFLVYRVKSEDIIHGITRTVAKYGNGYGELVVTEDGVVGINYLPPPTVRRVEDQRGNLLGFVQDVTGKFAVSQEQFDQQLTSPQSNESTAEEAVTGVSRPQIFEPWEVIHWRLRTKYMKSSYGFAVVDGARWVFRRLVMLEDAVLVRKLQSTARFAFYIDVGELPTEEALAHVNRIRQEYRKRKLYNPSTGGLDFKMNPVSQDEDFWLPSRSGKDSTRIDVVSGPGEQSLDELEYFLTKLFSAIKVPKEYLGLMGAGASRAALSQEDVRFARTVMRLQREIKNGFKQACRVHLAALGVDPDAVEWDLHMTVPSTIFELAQIEVLNAQVDLATRMMDFGLPKEWILERIMRFSQDDTAFILSSKEDEKRRDARFDASVQSGIMADYPEVVAAGLVGPEPAPDEGGGPMESVEARKILRLFDKSQQMLLENKRIMEENSRVLRKLKSVAPYLEEMKRTAVDFIRLAS